MLTTEDSLLLIVDVQGKLAQIMDNREALFANLQRMVKGALTLNMPIVWAADSTLTRTPIPRASGQ